MFKADVELGEKHIPPLSGAGTHVWLMLLVF